MKCEICEREVDRIYICKICGRKVCSNDYIFEEGICKACKMTLCNFCKEYLAIGICKFCGKLVCEKCSIEIGVERICKECYSKKKGSIR